MRPPSVLAGLAGLFASAALAGPQLWTASDPFVGKWTLDVARSRILDDMVVEAAGPNRLTFRFEGAPAETVVTDGTDQPGLQGTTLAVKTADARHLTVVRKQDGKTIVFAAWTLAPDGKTLRDDFSQPQPDGSRSTTHYLYRRMSGAAGWAGDWQSTTQPLGLKVTMEIRPAAGAQALAFDSNGAVKTVTFDGRDHPGAQTGQTLSGRRQSPRALTYTDKTDGKLTASRAYQLSPDGKTLTMTLRPAGQKTPNVLVFERG